MSKLNHATITVLLLTMLFTAINCGNPSNETETIDGVQYVHNTITKFEENLFEFEFIRRIGELDGDENRQFFRPDDIVRNSMGDYFINDRSNDRIQQFDKDLNYIRTIGRNGQGPGELESPTNLKIAGEDALLVIDSGNQNVQKFNSSGKYSDGIKPMFSLINLQFSINGGYIQNGITKTINSLENREEITEMDLPLFTLYDKNLKRIKDIGTTKDHNDFTVKNRFNLFSYAFDQANNHIVSYWNQNRIEKYSPDGDLIWVSDRIFPFSYSNVDEALHTHGALYSFENVQVDNRNRIWVQSCKVPLTIEIGINPREAVDIFVIDVFSEDGIHLARLNFPEKSTLMFQKIIGDRAYFFDRWNTMAIYEYRIVEKD